jgi:hypothetical protein
MTVEKKEEKENTETSGTEEQKQGMECVNTQSVEPQLEASAIADLNATVSAMGKHLNDLSAAITAIANQGSVNESIGQDNHETGEEDYPTIDIDGINRLLGV